MPRRHLPLACLGLLLLSACTGPWRPEMVRSSPPPIRSETDAIEELGRRFSAAYMRGDVEEMVSLYTPDAVIFPGNSEMIRGSEAIRRYWMLVEGERITRHRSIPTEIRIDGDHAYDYGIYEISGERHGQTWGPVLGKYVIVWRRGPQGWRMHLDMWNSRPQPRTQ